MIAYIQGTLFRRHADRIVVLAGGVGYEVLVPETVGRELAPLPEGEQGAQVHLYILYYQSERQPRPVLIGFSSEIQREFFERLISVEGIGPMAAVKAFTLPVSTIASAIEGKDTAVLRRLPGIGARTADKIVASLNGKVGKFGLMPDEGLPEPAPATHTLAHSALREEVERVLVQQMGYKVLEAHRMVTDALKAHPNIGTAEELFEEVYRIRRQ
jgi:Holliday junction DNA helicase RuvA